jgi:hypothetical protein
MAKDCHGNKEGAGIIPKPMVPPGTTLAYYHLQATAINVRGSWERICQYIERVDIERVEPGGSFSGANTITIFYKNKERLLFKVYANDFEVFGSSTHILDNDIKRALLEALGLDFELPSSKVRELCRMDPFRRAIAAAALRENENSKIKG